MITPDYVKTMARYNQWQNRNLYDGASQLDDEQRKRDRGAFFKSIHATLSHLLWGDMLWTSRFAGLTPPEDSPFPGLTPIIDWRLLKQQRQQRDSEIISWSKSLKPDDLAGNLTWYSDYLNQNFERQKTQVLIQFFNHQTHHRGQVHAMLTASGVKLEDTDLIYMPNS